MDWREKTSAEKGAERAVSRENALFEEKTRTHRILAAYLFAVCGRNGKDKEVHTLAIDNFFE